MIVNVWIEIRDNFAWPAENIEDDTELQAKNREALSRAADYEVVANLFKKRTQGPRSWSIYSFVYQADTKQEIEQAVERLASENPGMTSAKGAWHFEDGRQFGIELDGSGVPLYPISGSLINYMPDVDGAPAIELTDVNLLFGQAPRVFT